MAIRRTKAQIAAARYNKEVDAYKWYVVDLKAKKAITGFEYKEDAQDVISDYDGDKNYKVVAKGSLKKMGITIPNDKFKGLAVPKNNSFENQLREKIKQELSKVTLKNASKIYNLIQTEEGYKVIEGSIIAMMVKNDYTASACIPHLERIL